MPTESLAEFMASWGGDQLTKEIYLPNLYEIESKPKENTMTLPQLKKLLSKSTIKRIDTEWGDIHSKVLLVTECQKEYLLSCRKYKDGVDVQSLWCSHVRVMTAHLEVDKDQCLDLYHALCDHQEEQDLVESEYKTELLRLLKNA